MISGAKFWIAVIMGFLVPLVVIAEAPPTVAQLYSFAQRAYLQGDNAAAKAAFLRVLGADPNHQGARNYLRMIAIEERKSNTGLELTKKLQSLTLPKLDFKDVSLSTAIEFLKQQAEKLSDGALKLNIVLAVPPGYADSMKVTVELADIPFLEALKYVCKLSRTKYTIERHGIIIEMEGSSPPDTGADPAEPQPSTIPGL